MKHGQRCPHLGVSCHRGRSGNGAATRPVPAALSATQTLTLKLSTVMDYFVYLDLKSLEGKGFLSKFQWPSRKKVLTAIVPSADPSFV
jgi:hypothetical protein